MSTAAVIQLAAEADQDWLIRGNPDEMSESDVIYSLWISEMTKTPNFAKDYQESMIINVNYGGSTETTLPRYGDLIDALIGEIDLVPLKAPAMTDASGVAYAVTGAYYSNAIGYSLWRFIDLEIGGTSTQKLTCENLWMYEEMFSGSGNRMRELIGRFDYSADVEDSMIEWSSQRQRIYVVFPFYNHIYGQPSLAIPMCALYKHDIKVKMGFNQLSECVNVVYKDNDANDPDDPWLLAENRLPINGETNAQIMNADLRARLIVSFVYITQRERDIFLQDTVNYVITQDQNLPTNIQANATSTRFQVQMSHPVTFFDWRARQTNWATAAGRRRFSVGFRDRFDYSIYKADANFEYGTVQELFTSAHFKFNSHDRFPTDVAPIWFRRLMPALTARNQFTGYEYLWPFSIKIVDYNIDSTSNFSRIDTTFLELVHPPNLPACDLYFHAQNYNGAFAEEGMWAVNFSS